MTLSSSQELAGVLADERRLKVLAAVVLGARSAPAAAAAAGLSARETASALHRLTRSGLVVEDAEGLAADVAALRALAAREAAAEAAAAEAGASDVPPHLRAFVQGRRLLGLPAQAQRRWDVLAHVVQGTFETGVDYDEEQVNALLAPWCEGAALDHAALRRYLVESGLMSRGSGVYRLGPDAPPPSPGEQHVRELGLS